MSSERLAAALTARMTIPLMPADSSSVSPAPDRPLSVKAPGHTMQAVWCAAETTNSSAPFGVRCHGATSTCCCTLGFCFLHRLLNEWSMQTWQEAQSLVCTQSWHGVFQTTLPLPLESKDEEQIKLHMPISNHDMRLHIPYLYTD